MMHTRTGRGALLLAWILALAIAGTRAAEPNPEPAKPPLTKDQIEKAQKAVKDHLEKIKGGYGSVTRIEDKTVDRALPGYAFFAVLYRQFPVGRIPPTGLKSSNVFAVADDAKPKALTDAKNLEKFFKEALPAPANEAGLKDAARAWIRLVQELHQDGFFKFTLQDDSTKVTPTKSGKEVKAQAVVMSGGNGMLTVVMRFTDAGALTSLTPTSTVRAGIRPRCQATKLLDTDPIVRAMAEQDILVMGRAAKAYLEEQKAKASPELRKAIDRIWQRIRETDR
jgi:hypothetical protein